MYFLKSDGEQEAQTGEFRSTAAARGSRPDLMDAASLRKLTTLTLLNEYGLRMELPENVLCPPVPNRLNYSHWLKSTLRSLLLEGHDGRHSS